MCRGLAHILRGLTHVRTGMTQSAGVRSTRGHRPDDQRAQPPVRGAGSVGSASRPRRVGGIVGRNPYRGAHRPDFQSAHHTAVSRTGPARARPGSRRCPDRCIPRSDHPSARGGSRAASVCGTSPVARARAGGRRRCPDGPCEARPPGYGDRALRQLLQPPPLATHHGRAVPSSGACEKVPGNTERTGVRHHPSCAL